MSCSFPATSERALVCQLSGAPLKCLEGGEACGAAKVSGSPWGHCCQQPLRWSVSSQTKPLVGGGVCGGSHAGQHGSSPDPSRSVSGDKTPLELLLGWPVPGASEGCGLWCQPPQTPPHTLDTCVTCPRVSAAFCDLSGGGDCLAWTAGASDSCHSHHVHSYPQICLPPSKVLSPPQAVITPHLLSVLLGHTMVFLCCHFNVTSGRSPDPRVGGTPWHGVRHACLNYVTPSPGHQPQWSTENGLKKTKTFSFSVLESQRLPVVFRIKVSCLRNLLPGLLARPPTLPVVSLVPAV